MAAQHNIAVAVNSLSPRHHQSTTLKFGIISNLSSFWDWNILSPISESLVPKITKLLLVDLLDLIIWVVKKIKKRQRWKNSQEKWAVVPYLQTMQQNVSILKLFRKMSLFFKLDFNKIEFYLKLDILKIEFYVYF